MIATNCTEKKSILKEAHHSNLRSAAHQPGLTLEEEEEEEEDRKTRIFYALNMRGAYLW